jgi:pimeloyl-ACP methyl ester carboxylesterase
MPYFVKDHTRDHTLYYEIFQAHITPPTSSKSILLLHGFAGTATNDFARLIPLLQERHNILAPDLYGYGKSSQRTAYSTKYYRDDVADIKELLDYLKLQEVQVVAFSDGGIVGLLLAALHPKQVRSLAILGAQARLELNDVTAIRHWLLERPLTEDWQKELARLHGEPYWHSLPEMYVQAQEELLAEGGELIKKQELATIQCPTLIMHGKRDRVVPLMYAYELQEQIINAQLQLFDAGHAAHLRKTEEYNQIVIEFLETHA